VPNRTSGRRGDEVQRAAASPSLPVKGKKRVAVCLRKGQIRFVRLEGHPSVEPRSSGENAVRVRELSTAPEKELDGSIARVRRTTRREAAFDFSGDAASDLTDSCPHD
jgi:hypothetical protein